MSFAADNFDILKTLFDLLYSRVVLSAVDQGLYLVFNHFYRTYFTLRVVYFKSFLAKFSCLKSKQN